MSRFRGSAVRCARAVRSSVTIESLAIALGVTLVWLGIFEAITLTVPIEATPANRLMLAPEPGRPAHLHALPGPEWSIPVGRLDFDAYNLALDRDDERALAIIVAVAEWLPIRADQPVLILLAEGDAAQVQLLDGANTGRRGWLKRKYLAP
jgi:hypothetical protein